MTLWWVLAHEVEYSFEYFFWIVYYLVRKLGQLKTVFHSVKKSEQAENPAQISIHTCTVCAWLCNLRKLSSKNWLRKKVENFQLPGNFFCWKLKNQSNFALISTNYFQYGWQKQLLEIFTGLCGEVIINFIT